jgi:hypothetical protein
LRAFWFALFGGWVGGLIAAFVVLLISISIYHLRLAIWFGIVVFIMANVMKLSGDPQRDFWFGFVRGFGFDKNLSSIMAVIIWFFLFILSFRVLGEDPDGTIGGGSSSSRSSYYSGSSSSNSDSEDSDYSAKYEAEPTSSTEQVSDPLDHIVSYISGTKDSPPSYRTIIRDGGREYSGYGNSPEESQKRAHEDYKGKGPWG